MRIDEQHNGVLDELCSLLFSAIRRPLDLNPLAGTDAPFTAARSWLTRIPEAWGRLPPISPAGLVSLLLGISLTLMLGGSLTFVIGFMMMPWVMGMLMLLYFFGVISCISGLCKAALICCTPSISPPNTYPKKINGHGNSKHPIL